MDDHHQIVICWEHFSQGGRRSLSPWYGKLQKASRSRFDAALDTPVSRQQKTQKNKAGYAQLRELRVYANPQLRPLLCRGPVDRHGELTFLAPATEKGDRLQPENAVDVAIERYQEVVDDPQRYRRRFPAQSDGG